MTTDQLKWQKDNFENIETAWDGDLWDRRRLGEQLTNYVDRLQCGAVLALDARWGEGKTWFVRHWQKHLEDESHNVIYLDAFANDYLDDPFLVIASEIASKLDKTADKRLVHKFKKAAAVMQQGLLTLAPTLIASMISCALTSGIIPLIKIDSDSIKDKLDDAIDKVTENIGDKVTEAIQNKIDSYEEEKQSLFAFKNTLAQLAESLDKPLVFIIDELDRCRPDFAIRLIERIKHFFDIKNIVFVLVMDKAQFLKVVCHNYGYDENLGEEYLDKFLDFSITLPLISKASNNDLWKNSRQHYKIIKKFFNEVGESSPDICIIFYMSIFNKYMSTREIKKIINQYALLKRDHSGDIFLILALVNKETRSVYLDLINNFTSNLINREFDYLDVALEEMPKIEVKRIEGFISNILQEEKSKIINFFHTCKENEIIISEMNTDEILRGEKDRKRLEIIKKFSYKEIKRIEDFSEQFSRYVSSCLYEFNP
jgi:predicted KAP-like P-loop ATPase